MTEGLGVSGIPDDSDLITGAEPTKVMLSGDWHGNRNWALDSITYAKRKGADTIIQVGDFGWWPPTPTRFENYISGIQQHAEEEGVMVYWLDGNHEAHDQRDHFADANTEFFEYLPRGHRWNWWGKTWMSVGGGVSMDKKWRKEGVSWWPGEVLSDEDEEHAKRAGNVDIVVSHDCPMGVSIPGVGPDTKQRPDDPTWPQDIIQEAQQHRARMRRIWDATHPKWWIHGHFHISYTQWYGPTRFVGVACDGMPRPQTEFFLTPDML